MSQQGGTYRRSGPNNQHMFGQLVLLVNILKDFGLMHPPS